MSESFVDDDLVTLRAIARGAGVPDAEEMSHDELVATLREAGLGDPVDPGVAGPGSPVEGGFYHGEGVGRRETVGTPETDPEVGPEDVGGSE